MEGHRDIWVVIDGRIMMGYSCFTYTLVSAMEFCFSLLVVELKVNFKA